MKQYILLFFVCLATLGLNASRVDEYSLSSVIQQIEEGELEEQASLIINKLTVIALHNPGNLIARAYLWAFLNMPEKFSTKKSLVIKGQALWLAQEYEQAHSIMRRFIEINFLECSELAILINESQRDYIKESEEKEQLNKISTGKRTRVFNYKKTIDHRDSILGKQQLINVHRSAIGKFNSSLIKLYHDTHSLHVLEFIWRQSTRQKGYFPAHLFAKAGINLEADHSFLVNNYFGHSDILKDGSLELALSSQSPDEELERNLSYIAVTLGNEGALLKNIHFGAKGKKLFDDFDYSFFQDTLLYTAKILPNPEVILHAGIENLKNSTHTQEAIVLLEHFLALPEANLYADNPIINAQNFTPHALTQYYLDFNNPDEALEVFIRAWKKGFEPSCLIKSNIINAFSSNITKVLKRIDAEKINATSSFYHFMVSLCLEANNNKAAQNFLIKYLISLQNIKKSIVSVETLISFSDSLSLVSNESFEISTHTVLLKIKDLYNNLSHLIIPADMGRYYFVMYAFCMDLGLFEDAEQYLNLSAQHGHSFATILSAFNALMSYENFVQLVYTNSPQNISSNIQLPHHQPVMSLTNNQEAIDAIKEFIHKWENIHWKTSDRDELIKDFRNLVLANNNNEAVNSLMLHQNHGRRKAKYGNRASRFEIRTLIIRAQKFLENLTI